MNPEKERRNESAPMNEPVTDIKKRKMNEITHEPMNETTYESTTESIRASYECFKKLANE